MLALMLALALAGPDDGRWTREDTAWQLAYAAVVLVDWGQTLDVAARCGSERVRETNPLLGRCPSNERVNVMLPAALLGHAAIARALPRPYRRYWQMFTLGVEGYAVFRNYRVGLTVKW